MSWMKNVMQQVASKGRIYIEDATVDLWVLQHGWDFPVRYMPVATATGTTSVATITPKTAWRLLRLARHPDRVGAEEAFDYGKGIKATKQTLEDALELLDYPATLPEFFLARSWDEAKTAPCPPPSLSGGGPFGSTRGGNRG
jgi:hypothetical protein